MPAAVVAAQTTLPGLITAQMELNEWTTWQQSSLPTASPSAPSAPVSRHERERGTAATRAMRCIFPGDSATSAADSPVRRSWEGTTLGIARRSRIGFLLALVGLTGVGASSALPRPCRRSDHDHNRRYVLGQLDIDDFDAGSADQHYRACGDSSLESHEPERRSAYRDRLAARCERDTPQGEAHSAARALLEAEGFKSIRIVNCTIEKTAASSSHRGRRDRPCSSRGTGTATCRAASGEHCRNSSSSPRCRPRRSTSRGTRSSTSSGSPRPKT